MELRIEPYQMPEQIQFNYEEMKRELMERASVYETMIYTDDQIKLAKADRARLNALKKALTDERIRREREYMEPFAAFKAQISEIISIIDKPIAAIDKQVKAAEEQRKEEKIREIEDFWDSCVVPEGISLKQIFDLKWLNASVSMKTIKEAIISKLEQIEKDLDVVRSLPSYAFEAEQAYISSLDLARAVSEAHRLQEMAERKAAYEAQRIAAAEQVKQTEAENVPIVKEAPETPGTTEEVEEKEPSRQWVKFQAYLSTDEAKALGTWLKAMGIKYKAV